MITNTNHYVPTAKYQIPNCLMNGVRAGPKPNVTLKIFGEFENKIGLLANKEQLFSGVIQFDELRTKI